MVVRLVDGRRGRDDLVGGGAADQAILLKGFGAPHGDGGVGRTVGDVLALGRDFVDGVDQSGQARVLGGW